MKVMHIHNDAPWRDAGDVGDSGYQSLGGMPLYLHCLVEGQRARGIETCMIRFSPNPDRDMDAEHCHVLPTASQRPRPSIHRRLYRCVMAEDPDVIHMHSTYYAMNPIMLRGLRRMKPSVHTFHDVMPLCYRHNKLHSDGRLCERPIGYGCVSTGCYKLGSNDRLHRDLLRVLIAPFRLEEYRRLPMCIVPSGYLRELLIANGFREDRVRVLSLFSRFEDEGVAPPEPRGDRQAKILFVGRLVPDKGVSELMEAFSLLIPKPWQSTIVGDGALLDTIRRVVRAKGLVDRVEFAGHAPADSLQRHYEECSFVVFPSLLPESFGLVGVEAMTFGKPVVGFACGGVLDWLEDGVNGLLASRGDVPALARQIERLIDNPGLCHRLGMNGFDMVRARFTRQAHIDGVLGVYDLAGATADTEGD